MTRICGSFVLSISPRGESAAPETSCVIIAKAFAKCPNGCDRVFFIDDKENPKQVMLRVAEKSKNSFEAGERLEI